jgi:sulfide:quinone oxidoreductase
VTHVVICGAGFAGLELSTLLSTELAGEVDVTLIDASDAFVFGFSKLDVMFGRRTSKDVRIPYADITKPGVAFRQERITQIDPRRRVVTTDRSSYDADILVIALGADYDLDATPGVAGHEFYSVDGAARMREELAAFDGGRAVVGVCGPFYKCPPAPYEAALLLHDHLTVRGIREKTDISVFSSLPMPIPVSKPTSAAIVTAMDDRGIVSTFSERVVALNGGEVKLASGAAAPCDLFLGVPVHVAPQVVVDAGLTTDGWIAVDKDHLTTSFENVYAVGDVASAPVPRAGVFAEGQARAAFAHIAAKLRGGDAAGYDGRGTCFLEFGGGEVGKVEVDFYSGPEPVAPLVGPSKDFAKEKELFGSSRRERWFGATGDAPPAQRPAGSG